MIKNQSVWMLTSCTKYQVFVSLYVLAQFNGITFINPTAVEFHHPLLELFHILIFKNGF